MSEVIVRDAGAGGSSNTAALIVREAGAAGAKDGVRSIGAYTYLNAETTYQIFSKPKKNLYKGLLAFYILAIL